MNNQSQSINQITFRPLDRHSTSIGRFYVLPDGQEVPSVTTIIDGAVSKGQALIHWAASEERKLALDTAEKTYADLAGTDGAGQFMGGPEFRGLMEQNLGKTKAHLRKLKAAADLGTAAHNEIERRMKELMGKRVPGPQPMPEGAELVLMAFEDYQKAHDLRPLASEGSVYDYFNGFAGSFDLLAMLDGKITLIDIKSSKRIWRTQFLQLAAYHRCIQHHPALKGQRIQSLILRLPKTLDDVRIEPKIIAHEEHEEHWRAFLDARNLWCWLNEFKYAPPTRPVQSAREAKPWAPRKPPAGTPVPADR